MKILLIAIMILSPTIAEAKVKVTVNNKTPQKISIAFGYGMSDTYKTEGWHSVEAGASKTIMVDAVSSLASHELDWYTESAGKKMVWKGGRNEWVNPAKEFEYEYFQGEKPRAKGTAQVGFHTAPIKDSGDNENGTATLNLTAK